MLPGFEQIGIAVCVENLESDEISALIISMTNDFQPRVFIGDNRLGAILRTRLAVLILLEEKSAGHIVEVVGENVRFRIERLV